jgi:hypothetical protein
MFLESWKPVNKSGLIYCYKVIGPGAKIRKPKRKKEEQRIIDQETL